MRLIAAVLLASAAWGAKAIPPSPRSYVHNEGVISAGAEARLSAALRGVEQATGHQFVAALFQSLDGESLEDYTNKVFRAWKIGGKKGDDGLLFCLYKGERRWRVEVGYGLEGTLTDLQAAELARVGIPFFQRDDFDSGVQAVVDGLKTRLEGGPAPRRHAGRDPTPDWIAALIVFIALLVWFFLRFEGVSGSSSIRGGGWSSGSSWDSGSSWSSDDSDSGGFSGGGGSSGGGGASGGW